MIQIHQLLAEEPVDNKLAYKTLTLPSIVPVGAIEKSGDVQVSLSVDGTDFETVPGDSAEGRTARYVRLQSGSAGRIKLYVGEGYTAEPDSAWTDVLKRYSDWAGADGIYSFNLADGNDAYGHKDARTLFLFSDTIVSQVDRETLCRSGQVFMTNNSYALFDGGDPKAPGAMRFFVNRETDGKPVAVIRPNRDCYDFDGTGEDFSKAYFWNQDGLILGDKFFIVLHLVTEDNTREEGFKFRVLNECIAEADIRDGVPDIANAKQHRTNLYHRDKTNAIVYGAGILPYTRANGWADGDGYIYIYGRMSSPRGKFVSLCAARVRPEDFADWTKWRFYNGVEFSGDIRQSAPLLDHVCSELSVTPIVTGQNRGKFLAVFKYDDLGSDYVAYAIGDSPTGPFGEPRKVFYTGADRVRDSVYTYNAKAHPHLSEPESLLVSYNVNCRTWEDHMANGHIYRPRFIRLHDTTVVSVEKGLGGADTANASPRCRR